jgi:DNA helicase II / ATP-dependent DNA helicase PcrA
MNFGDVKGMTFDRTVIYPHAAFQKYLKTGKLELAGQSLTRTYVAVTRARNSVAIVVPDNFSSPILQPFAF